jgi:hypothetical protein
MNRKKAVILSASEESRCLLASEILHFVQDDSLIIG